MNITPSFVVTFETDIKGLVTGNWDRVAKNLMWDVAMKSRPGSTKKELLTWLLETAAIYPEGQGGNKRFDDIVAASTSLVHTHSGAGLRLTRDEIEDNVMANNPTVGAMDYASKWARDMGAAEAYEPQKQLFNLILAGTTALGYDGVSFFNSTHPVNPNGSSSTYSNVVGTVPIHYAALSGSSEQDKLLQARRNLGTALAAIRTQRFVNNIPRFLVPTTMFVQSADYDYANLVVSAGVIGQTTNTSAVDPKNPSRRLEVHACPELDGETAGTYYIGCEDILSDELGAFVWSELVPFNMKTYGPMDEAVLNRMNQFEWQVDGRNTAIYGHPYLFYRCTSA